MVNNVRGHLYGERVSALSVERSSHLQPNVRWALFKGIIRITPYLLRFHVEGELKALLRHHLVVCLTIPLVAVDPLLLGLSIATGKGDAYDVVARLQ